MPRLPLRVRLKAWWEGYDLSRLPRPRTELHMRDRGPEAPKIWSADRLDIAEKVWGEGYLSPGGQTYLPILVKPFGLNETMSVIDIGCGLGGSGRFMAKQYGAYVTGYEENERLREEGTRRSEAAGLARKATLLPFTREKPMFEKRFDAVLAKDILYTVQDKDAFLEAVKGVCKPRAPVLFTDYCLSHSGTVGQAVTSWKKMEETRPWLISIGEEAALFAKHGFDLRIKEDITDTYRKLILTAWDTFAHVIPKGKPDSDTEAAIFDEAETWLRRIAAMNTGDLRVYRLFALAPGDHS